MMKNIIMGIFTGLVASIILIFWEVYVGSRKNIIKDIVIESQFLEKIEIEYIYREIDKITHEYNLEMSYDVGIESQEEKHLIDSLTIFKPVKEKFYNVQIIRLTIKDSADLSKDDWYDEEIVKHLDLLNYDEAIIMALPYSNIPQYKILWEDEYGYVGEYYLQENNATGNRLIKNFEYQNSIKKEFHRKLNISRKNKV